MASQLAKRQKDKHKSAWQMEMDKKSGLRNPFLWQSLSLL
ncbi:hypothetical protein BLGI_217 [Brevibacillus laterosporus GI-9]|nr:hypothetical protein BLGI_217 [Brevibacillus laterosporus GI-9]